MKYIDANRIRAEIERRMDKHWEGLPDADSPEDDWTHNELCELGAYKELEHLETFISTFESEKPVSEELEETARLYAIPHYTKDIDVHHIEEYSYDTGLEAAFISGAQWQKEQDRKHYAYINLKDAKDAVVALEEEKGGPLHPRVAFVRGAEWQKNQMAKDTVEGEYDSYPAAIYLETQVQGIEHGDKVRIIIVKEG